MWANFARVGQRNSADGQSLVGWLLAAAEAARCFSESGLAVSNYSIEHRKLQATAKNLNVYLLTVDCLTVIRLTDALCCQRSTRTAGRTAFKHFLPDVLYHHRAHIILRPLPSTLS